MHKSRLSVMTSIVLAMLVSSMDTTITNTTMPVISEELGQKELYAWTFASYMIFSTVVAPIAGRLSDMFGRKRVFGFGILLFLIGSILCGLSDSMLQLVLFRGIQGFGAGFMLPFPAIIAGDLFTIEQRGKIQAFFSGMWGLSALLAPMLGALFVEVLTWRWIFFINIPLCILSFLLLLSYREVYESRPTKVDVAGALLFSAGISLILLTTAVEKLQLFYFLVGALLIGWFYRMEKRHASPIIPLELFHNRPIAWMIINAFLTCAALFGTSSFVPMFLQEEGYGIMMSGLPLLGMSAGWMSVSVWAGRWILKWGYRPLLIIGNALLVGSGFMLLFLREGTAYWYITAAMVLQGLAYGMIVTVSIIGAQQLVDGHRKGISTSIQMFARNIGTAIGITIMGALLTQAAGFYEGIRSLFLFGFMVSVIGFVSALGIRVKAMNTVPIVKE